MGHVARMGKKLNSCKITDGKKCKHKSGNNITINAEVGPFVM